MIYFICLKYFLFINDGLLLKKFILHTYNEEAYTNLNQLLFLTKIKSLVETVLKKI